MNTLYISLILVLFSIILGTLVFLWREHWLTKKRLSTLLVSGVLLGAGVVIIMDGPPAANGDIGAAVADVWEFDTEEGKINNPNALCRLGTSDYYVCSAYGDTGTDNDGFLRVFQASNVDGTITESLVDSWEYDISDGYYAGIYHIDGNVYAVYYYDSGASIGKIFTTTIWSTNGTLKEDTIDSFSFAYGFYASYLLHVTGNIYAFVYQEYGGGYDHQIETIEITTAGVITDTNLDIEEVDATSTASSFCSGVVIDSDTIAMVLCESVGFDNWLYTYDISGAGLITDTATEAWEFDNTPSAQSYPYVVNVDSNTVAVTYLDSALDGWIKTINISSTGDITQSFADSLEYADSNTITYPWCFPVASAESYTPGVYGILFKDVDSDGWVYTVNVSADGSIGAAIVDSLEYNTTNMGTSFPACVYMGNSYYLIGYNSPSTDFDGYICTVNIETPSGSAWVNRPPIVSNWGPANQSTNIILYNRTSALISDQDGNATTVCFWYAPPSSTFASPSSWTKAQQNNSHPANTTARDMNSSYVNIYGYYYWWKVTANDGTVNSTNGTKWFRTKYNNVTHGPADTTAPSPANAATGQNRNPQLSALVNSTIGKPFNITFRTNASGTWTTIGTNTSVTNGTYRWTPTTMTGYSTKYWWSTNCTGFAAKNWNNDTYYFTTMANPVAVTINYAGNYSDKGGPFWQPPGETIWLWNHTKTVWRNGYYTNDSYQSEGWVYINATVTSSGTVDDVYLHWHNETTNKWTNNTYKFVKYNTDYYAINTSINITNITAGHKYSFDVWANDTLNNIKDVFWNKTGIGGSTVRRYVSLDNIPVNISYKPFYTWNASYLSADIITKDRLHHDSGPDGRSYDTGYLTSTVPTSTINYRNCTGYVGFWFDNNSCVLPGTLTNIYYHVWWKSDDGSAMLWWNKSRDRALNSLTDSTLAKDKIRTTIGYSGDIYNLSTAFLSTDSTAYTDNNIYEFIVGFNSTASKNPFVICNRSFTSFVIFNVPSNATLDSSYNDSDSDGLCDRQELYLYYTNPFLSDTDGDGVSDYEEKYSGSDPNNYTDTITYNFEPSLSCSPNATKNTTINPKLNATCADMNGGTMNATWWANTYRDTHIISEDCSTWNTALWDQTYAGPPTVAHGYWYFNVSASQNAQYQAQTDINHSFGLYKIRFKTANSTGGTGRVPGVNYAFWLYGLYGDEIDMLEVIGENVPPGSIANEITVVSYNKTGDDKSCAEWYSNPFNWEDGNWHTFEFLYTPWYFVIIFDSNYSYAMMNNYRFKYSKLTGPIEDDSYIPSQPMKLMIDVNGAGTQTKGFSFIVDQIDYYAGTKHNVGSNTSFSDSTVHQTYTGFTEAGAGYIWGVNLSDGNAGYNNATNWFTTEWNATGGTVYDQTIRNNGMDYFIWLGVNTTASVVATKIIGFDESSESISKWNRTTWTTSNGLWQTYNGTGTGINFQVKTFDVLRTVMADATGNQTIEVSQNPNWDYTSSRSYSLMNLSKNKGYNYSAFNKVAATSLSAISSSIGLATGEFIGRWNRTTFTWNLYINGFALRNYGVYRWDVIVTKVGTTRTWNT